MNTKSMKTGMMLLATGIFLVGLMTLNGCKKDEATAEHAHEHDEHDGHMHDEHGNHIEAVAAVIEQKTCPVMEGNPINKALFVEYKDQKVYFCCPPCKDKFTAEPAKYIAKLPQFKQEVQ
ncbi:MAG: YHS domain-containing protein [Planctomycetes bacterium]|nr:YHS domain-containing protein [Planctomycetota bacterium]